MVSCAAVGLILRSHSLYVFFFAHCFVRTCRRTLAQIDEIMDERESGGSTRRKEAPPRPSPLDIGPSTPRAAHLALEQAPSQSPRKHVNVQNSPRAPAASITAAATAQPAASVSAAASAPADAVTSRPDLAASRSSSRVAAFPARKLKPAVPVTRHAKTRKPMARLESELDSALDQAQNLLADFMHNIQ